MALHTVSHEPARKSRNEGKALRAYNNAHYLEEKLLKLACSDGQARPFFKEFVLETDLDVPELNRGLEEKGFLSGLDLSCMGFKGAVLFCATEVRTKDEIDAFVEAVKAHVR